MDCEAYALFWKRLVKTEVNFFSLELKNQGRRRFIPALKDRVFAPSAEIKFRLIPRAQACALS